MNINFSSNIADIQNEFLNQKLLNENLIKENNYLKKVIAEKTNIISSYEALSNEFSDKFSKIDATHQETVNKLKSLQDQEKKELFEKFADINEEIGMKDLKIREIKAEINKMQNDNIMLKQRINELRFQNMHEQQFYNNKFHILQVESSYLEKEKNNSLKIKKELLDYFKNYEVTNQMTLQKEKEYLDIIENLKNELNEKDKKYFSLQNAFFKCQYHK